MAGLTTIPSLLWISPATYLLLLGFTALMGKVVARSATKAFCGITGDVLGCGLEITELGVLAVLNWSRG